MLDKSEPTVAIQEYAVFFVPQSSVRLIRFVDK